MTTITFNLKSLKTYNGILKRCTSVPVQYQIHFTSVGERYSTPSIQYYI